MLEKLNIITLPKICFSAVPSSYEADFEKLILEDLYVKDPIALLNSDGVEEIVNDKSKKLYCNLHVRKNLQIEAQLLSGAVQALTCDYHIYSEQDIKHHSYNSVKDILNLGSLADNSQFYREAVRILKNAIDFELIEETDFVKMPYTHIRHVHNTQPRNYANWSDYRNFDNSIENVGFKVPKGMPVIHLRSVLQYAKNRGITKDEAIKIRALLRSTNNEKVAVTLMNTFNPEKSFVELICLINSIDGDISRNINGVPVLPFISGAYNLHTKATRGVDAIVNIYKRFFGNPDDEILERIADAYHNPNYEESSVFDFKLKVKRR